MTNLKATHLTIFCKMHWKKVPMIAKERGLYLMDVHTHTVATHTHRDLQSCFGGENSSKGLNFNKK